MKFVLASYVVTNDFNEPEAWINRIRFYTGILEALHVNNQEITSIEQINYEGKYSKNGVNYHFLRLSKLGRYFPFKLHSHIKALQPDVVIVQSLLFPLQVIQLRLKLGWKTKIILQNHAEQPFTGIKKYWQRWADHYIDGYLFTSKDLGMDWINKRNLSSASKIHEVMEVSSVFYPIEDKIALSKTGASGDPFFLWVGRLNANKDPLNVVSAFLEFTYFQPFATLYMIYGTDDLLPEINELLKDHPNKNSVILIGKVPNDELLFWYNSATFIISGSHYEGGGTAICEAMSCGCIPVVTDIAAFRMVTNNGKCGLLYEAGNKHKLLSALIETQQIDILQKCQECFSYYESNLSFAAIAKKIQEVVISIN